MDPAYGYRPLEDLLPDIKVSKVAVLIDYENIHIGLEQRDGFTEPTVIVDAFRRAVGDLGEVTKLVPR